MKWPFKRNKCKLCKKIIKAKHKTHEVRVHTGEGLLELDVCSGCAHILDKSADAMLKRNVKEGKAE